MLCPKCGAETGDVEKYCGSCGNPLGSGKALCDGCMGAFKPADLSEREGRRLCPMCREREDRRKSGTRSLGAAPGASPAPAGGPVPVYPPRPGFAPRPDLAAPQTSVLAILSLVVSILVPLGVPGLVLGVLSLVRIRKSAGRLEGTGLAIGGTALSAVTLSCWACMVAAGILGAGEARQQAVSLEAQARIREIAKAEQQYFAELGRFGTLDDLASAGCLGGPLDETRYRFDAQPVEDGFQVTAVPVSGKGSHFLLDAKGALRHELGKPATASSPLWTGGVRTATAPTRAPVRRTGG